MNSNYSTYACAQAGLDCTLFTNLMISGGLQLLRHFIISLAVRDSVYLIQI